MPLGDLRLPVLPAVTATMEVSVHPPPAPCECEPGYKGPALRSGCALRACTGPAAACPCPCDADNTIRYDMRGIGEPRDRDWGALVERGLSEHKPPPPPGLSGQAVAEPDPSDRSLASLIKEVEQGHQSWRR